MNKYLAKYSTNPGPHSVIARVAAAKSAVFGPATTLPNDTNSGADSLTDGVYCDGCCGRKPSMLSPALQDEYAKGQWAAQQQTQALLGNDGM